MVIEERPETVCGIRFSIKNGKMEVARGFLYVLKNDLHNAPFGLLEDLYVDEAYRAQGLGTQLVQEIIKKAKQAGCYKLIATSRQERPKVHALYARLGFSQYGFEFRMNIDSK